MIAHVRILPGFWIAVEELERPDLRSCPVIMGGLPHQRGTVREANRLAQQYGVQVGMALSQAHQHCPEALFLVPDLSRYESLWQKILDLLQAYTPMVESLEMGQAACDLSGCGRRWRDGWDAGCEIVDAIDRYTSLSPCVGIASNRLTSQLASTMESEGVIVVDTGQEAAFLAHLPITRLPDVDPRLALSFQVLGLQTIGQLAALPVAAVERRFGAVGKRLHAYARGIDSRQVTPPRETPSISAHRNCEDGSLEEALASLRELANQCEAELQERHLRGRLVELTLVWEPGIAHAVQKKEITTAKSNLLPAGKHNVLPVSASHPPQPSLLVPYRIHSMMVQPGMNPTPLLPLPGSTPQTSASLSRKEMGPGQRHWEGGSEGSFSTAKIAVRTAINTASPLVEQGERILRRLWSKEPRSLHRIELKVSEFEEPLQLSFAECMRLDQTGGLAGLGPERRQAIMQQEHVLTARHGGATFRHVAQVNPASVLTERRFRWQPGLSWSPDEIAPAKSRRKRA